MSSALVITIIIIAMVGMLILFSRLNTSKKIARRKTTILNSVAKLKTHAESDNEYERKDAIIRLDTLLAKAFNHRYKNSLTCGENLKKSDKLFRKDTYQKIWDVHKIRNNIVHDGESITLEEAKKAYHIYKLAINRVLK